MKESTSASHKSYDSVYFFLRDKVVRGEFAPGDKLPEAAIARELGVSRTPVRDALRRLSDDGMVRIVANCGARVITPTKSEIDAAYLVRENLELLSVRLVCDKGLSIGMLSELEGTITREAAAVEAKNVEGAVSANGDFHRLIADACGNCILTEFIAGLVVRTNVYVLFCDRTEERCKEEIAEHRAILRLLAERNFLEAEDKMRCHLRKTRSSLERVRGYSI